jgi:long-chain fatty acid transport protein
MMNSNPRSVRLSVLAALSGGAALLAMQSAGAAGFALAEQNTSGLGNAYAGAAAVAEDASTVFFNSAGLTQLKRTSLVMNGSLIKVKSEFRNGGSQAALGQSLGGSGGDAGGSTLVPALYAAIPLTDKVTAGVGVNAPFGLKTEYSDDFMGRFQGLISDVKTTNINTALAFKLNDVVSVGIGADYQSLDATLTKNVNYTAAIAQVLQAQLLAGSITLAQFNGLVAANAGLQGNSVVKGTDSAWGYDLGLLFNFNDRTHIGLSYRSAMSYNVGGNATFAAPVSGNAAGQAIITGASASTLANGPVTLAIKLPASARLAMSQKLGSAVELLGEVSWTQWSNVEELRVKRLSGVTLSNTPENWDDTLRYSLGANFQVSNAVKLRLGAAQDQSPVPDATRTPRLPDGDRTWLSAGAKVKVTDKLSMDVGYTHIKVKDAALNQNDGSTTAYGLLNGQQQTSIDIVGVQATVSF